MWKAPEVFPESAEFYLERRWKKILWQKLSKAAGRSLPLFANLFSSKILTMAGAVQKRGANFQGAFDEKKKLWAHGGSRVGYTKSPPWVFRVLPHQEERLWVRILK